MKSSWTAHLISSIAASTLPDTDLSNSEMVFANYNALSREMRVHFWVKLVTKIIEHESGFDPNCVYRESFGVDSIGLLQLSYEDHESYGTKFNPSDLTDPEQNIFFGVEIMDILVKRDKCISLFTFSYDLISNKSAGPHYFGLSEYWSTMRPGHEGFGEIVDATKDLEVFVSI